VIIALIGLLLAVLVIFYCRLSVRSLPSLTLFQPDPTLDYPLQLEEVTPASGKGFNRPLGVAAISGDRLVVADSGNSRVVLLSMSGEILRQYGEIGYQSGKMDYPVAVAVDEKRTRLYVADSNKNSLQVWELEGDYLYDLPLEADRVKLGVIKPTALTLGDDGSLFVSDSMGHRVLVFSATGNFIRAFGGKGQGTGELSYPNGLVVVQAKQKVYVADSNNGRVVEFNTRGEFQRNISMIGERHLVTPRGIALDRKRNVLYILDTLTHQVISYHPDTSTGLAWGAKGTGAGRFSFPNGIALDDSGKLYIADRENNRVVVYAYPGN